MEDLDKGLGSFFLEQHNLIVISSTMASSKLLLHCPDYQLYADNDAVQHIFMEKRFEAYENIGVLLRTITAGTLELSVTDRIE